MDPYALVNRRVRLVGLTSRPKDNGKTAICEAYDAERPYGLTVRIHGGEQVRVVREWSTHTTCGFSESS